MADQIDHDRATDDGMPPVPEPHGDYITGGDGDVLQRQRPVVGRVAAGAGVVEPDFAGGR